MVRVNKKTNRSQSSGRHSSVIDRRWKRLGEAAHKQRTKLKKSRALASEQTRISERAITAFERGDYKRLGSKAYRHALVREYLLYLEFDEEQVERKLIHLLPEDLDSGFDRKTPGSVRAIVTSKVLPITLSSILIVGVLIYLVSQALALALPPPLTVFEPTDELVSESHLVQIRGETEENVDIRIGSEVVLVAEDGSFETEIIMSTGVHTLQIVATNQLGKSRVVERVVQIR